MTRALTMLAIATALAIHPAARADEWSYGSSDHFETYAAGNQARVREIAGAFEGYRASFQDIFKLPAADGARTKLVVFGSAKDFDAFKPRDESVAFWLDTPAGDFIVLQTFDKTALPTAIHELTHVVVGRMGVTYPLWLNEGLAEFYSTMIRDGSKIRMGAPLPNAIDALGRGDQLLPLGQLFDVDEQSPADQMAGLVQRFYAESWALTHMLLSSDPYKKDAAAAFAAIGAGHGAAEVLTSTYRRPIDAIGADLKRYLLRFRLATTTTELPRAAANAPIATRPADPIALDVTLASILGWQPSHQETGIRILDDVETRAPDDLAMLEARGLIEFYSQRCDAARTDLGKAIAHNSTSPIVQRAYATLTARPEPMPTKPAPAMMPGADQITEPQIHVVMASCVAR